MFKEKEEGQESLVCTLCCLMGEGDSCLECMKLDLCKSTGPKDCDSNWQERTHKY